MKCPRCNVEMKIGIAIDNGPFDNVRTILQFRHLLNYDTLSLIEVYKCPKCGHSDDGVNSVKLVGIIDNR